MKKLTKILVGIVVVLVLLFLGRNLIAQSAVQGAVRTMTGFPLHIGSLDLDLGRFSIKAQKIKLFNPSSFRERVFVDMPELFVDIDRASVGTSRLHIEDLRIGINEVVIVKNKDGKLNLDALKPKSGGKKPAGKGPEMQIDHMNLRIGKVVYKDYSAGATPSVQEFNLNLDENYQNVSSLQAIAPLIVSRALLNTTLGSVLNFDMSGFVSKFDLNGLDMNSVGLQRFSSLAQDFAGGAGSTAGKVGSGATAAAKEAADSVKKLFNF